MPLRLLAVVGALTLGLISAPAHADDNKPAHSAVKAAPRDGSWLKRHEGFVAEARKGGVNVLFLGDSITDAWRRQPAWAEHFAPLKAANFGISGDQTQHVLWRLQNGELEGIDPKVVVLMIGTNNTRSNSAAEIADGITAIVHELRHKKPDCRILLLGVFPRSAKASDSVRAKIKEVNQVIAKLDDGKQVRYLDIGDKFLGSEGELTKDIMPDFLHLSTKGYQIWAEAIHSRVEEMLKD